MYSKQMIKYIDVLFFLLGFKCLRMLHNKRYSAYIYIYIYTYDINDGV